jgi:3-dehydroquinate dehydratase-1
MNKVKHCLPLIETTVESVSKKMQAAPDYDFYEIWLDYLNDDCVASVSDLCREYENRMILLSRRLNLEPIQRSFDNRMDLTRILSEFPCYFDFDIHAQREELDALQSEGLAVKKILSYHNYKSTPSDDYLQGVLREMDAFNPAISKLACFCETAMDGVRLLSLLERKAQSQALIVLGMGIHGLPTRVFGFQLGNEFTFSPVARESESAPGQLTRDELNEIVEVLNRAG